ncbi:hypothetical protein QAD02_003842 [Eretmocerus hayati]|uniref:Uncharacterized protein n=1 Tax=Eretmocerus hayati TaxID=131215 RepID=A0ACC2NNY5_9HYME|nr:hypothetical protein QAD02_003842 [Eretmocerus hayati]
MTLSEFAGCAMLAYGPPLVMFAFSVAVEPIRIIILIVSAFFWLISLLFSSIVWYTITPLQKYLWFGMIYSVIFQEVFRYLLYRVLRKAEKGLEKVTTANVSESRDIFAYVCGLGFGLMSGAFAYINVLSDAMGPATMGLLHGNEYFFLISAATTLCFILLHTFWGVIFFSALDNKRWWLVGGVVVSHLLASCVTLLNSYDYHIASLFLVYGELLVTTAVAFNVSGGTVQNLLKCFVRKEE